MSNITGDTRFWNHIARKYATDPIADVAGYERTLESTRQHLNSGDVVLEIGCGTGTTALRLAACAARYLATDISTEMIAIAREKARAAGCNAEFEVATPDKVTWLDETFNVALAFNVLHLITARELVLKGVHRLLKPGGLFISKTPCLGEMNPIIRLVVPVMQAVGKAPSVAFFSAKALEREIEETGFEIIERARHASRGKDARPFLVARKP